MKEETHDEKAESEGRVEITPPKGFTPPEVKDGRFDIVDTWQVKPDGKICLVRLGDTEMPGYDGKESDKSAEHKPDYSELTGPMMAAMGGGGEGGGGNPGMGTY